MAMINNENRRAVTVSPITVPTGKLHYAVANLQGIGTRERQEDSFTLVNALDEQQYDNLGLMFAVCDGMGGMKDGKLASETAISSFRSFFANMNRNGRIAAQLKESVFAASNEVEKLLGGDGGSTVVIGIIYHEQLYFASVGDSFFYLKRNGRLYRLNTDHNLCHYLYLKNIRNGDFDPTACRADREAHALAQFLGMSKLSTVDCSVRPMFLQRGDILLACSDGVGGMLSEQEISDALDRPDPQEMCRQLEQRIIMYAHPNQDNYTALVIKCE